MILTTTNSVEGKEITNYLGIVTGSQYSSTFKGMSFKDMFSSAKYYEMYANALEEAKENAFQKMTTNAKNLNADAIVGIAVDIETAPESGLSIVSIVGTAVKLSALSN